MSSWATFGKMCENSPCDTINNSTCTSTKNDVNQLDSDSLVNADPILNSESLHDVHDQIHIVDSDATNYNDSLILDQHDL